MPEIQHNYIICSKYKPDIRLGTVAKDRTKHLKEYINTEIHEKYRIRITQLTPYKFVEIYEVSSSIFFVGHLLVCLF